MKSCQIIHGGDRYGAAIESGLGQEELLDFSANINPLGIQERVKEAVNRGLSEAAHYPDPLCRELRAALAGAEGIQAAQILCGNGGADLIYRLVYALRPQKALVTAPSFAEYEEALWQAGAEIRHWELGEDLRVHEDFLDGMTADLDLLFLCNPNNPTGLLTERSLLLSVLEKAKELKIQVLVDECFLDFCGEQEAYTLKGVLAKYPNLFILKSFTKLYAIPGLRLGYLLSADEELLERVRRAGQPWSVSGLAQAAGMAALSEPGFRERTVRLVDRERAYLKSGLEQLGLQVLDGQANYLCFRAAGEEALYEKLLTHGILIRRCANYRGLTGEHYRAAVRKHLENERLLDTLKYVLREQE